MVVDADGIESAVVGSRGGSDVVGAAKDSFRRPIAAALREEDPALVPDDITEQLPKDQPTSNIGVSPQMC